MSLVKIDPKTLPAHIQARAQSTNSLLAGLGAGGGAGMPRLSFRGGKFRVQVGENETVLMNGRSARTEVAVVIVGAKETVDKAHYPKAYVEGETVEPDCWSRDGRAPDPQVAEPRAESCMTCPLNAYGSAANGKGKACGDRKTVLVSPITEDGDIEVFDGHEVFQLTVPPTSFKNLREYGKQLAAHGLAPEVVVTSISLDPASTHPVLCFNYMGWLSEDSVAHVDELIELPEVQSILSSTPAAPALPAPKPVVPAPTPTPAPTQAEAPKKRGRPPKAAVPVETAEPEPVVVAPPAAPVSAPTTTAPEPSSDDLNARAAAILAGLKK